MRAVFACMGGAYRQVGYWDVNGVSPVRGASKDEELEIYKATHTVGVTVMLPDTVTDRARVYLFSEGKDHNQLTLTDAREIYNMRKWIQSRGDRNNDFIELSCDEEAEHITEAVFREPVAVPKEPEDNEGYTDWDLEYSNLLRRR